MADDLQNIIKGIRSSYQKTNIVDVNLEDLIKVSPQEKIGFCLNSLPNESNKKYAINFDPVETTYLDKLISEQTLNKRIIVDKKDFFKTIVFLDYFVNILSNETGLLDELYTLAKDLERKHEDLDPDLGLIVRYAGMYYVSQQRKNWVTDNSETTGSERFRTKNKKVGSDYQTQLNISPVYEAVGSMVYDLVNNPVLKQEVPKLQTLYDLKAAIFIDSVLDQIQTDEIKEKIVKKVQDGSYYKASHIAMISLSKEVSDDGIKQYIKNMVTEKDK
jgi:hypothetical protein